jgi:hypothetical protein
MGDDCWVRRARRTLALLTLIDDDLTPNGLVRLARLTHVR